MPTAARYERSARVSVLTASVVLSLAAPHARAEVRTERVEYRHGEKTLVGHLVYDPELVGAWEGGAPGVVVFPEWWGVNGFVKDRARALAEEGYVAFAADLYGDGKTTESAEEAGALAAALTSDVERWRGIAAAAVGALRTRPEVNGASIAAIGFCLGGSTALQAAYAPPAEGGPLTGVVAFHSSLPAPSEQERAALRAPVLVLHGTDDPMADMAKVNAFIAAMEGAPVEWRVSLFGGAQHAFTNPGADKAGIPGVKYDEPAAEGAWREMSAFFRDRFGEPSGGKEGPGS